MPRGRRNYGLIVAVRNDPKKGTAWYVTKGGNGKVTTTSETYVSEANAWAAARGFHNNASNGGENPNVCPEVRDETIRG